MEKNREMEVDLKKMVRYYLRYWKGILLSTILAGAIMLGISVFVVTPQYQSHVTIYVNTSSDQAMNITSNDLATAQKLVSTYVNIIKSNTVLDTVIQQGNLNMTADEIREAMTAGQIDDTEMFNVFITDPDPEMAAHIANTIADVAPAKISAFVKGSSTEVIDHAIVAEKPITPNYVLNTFLGLAGGFVLYIVILTFRYLFNTKITDKEDVEMYLGVPVLGMIPSIEVGKKGK